MEEEIPELVKVLNPMAIDEGRNQAGPSDPQHRLLHAPSTPRSAAQKTMTQEHEKGEWKKMKMTVEKPTHPFEASTPEPKRLRQPNIERRVEITQVGEVSYHMDYIIGEEEMAVWNQENEEEEETALETRTPCGPRRL